MTDVMVWKTATYESLKDLKNKVGESRILVVVRTPVGQLVAGAVTQVDKHTVTIENGNISQQLWPLPSLAYICLGVEQKPSFAVANPTLAL